MLPDRVSNPGPLTYESGATKRMSQFVNQGVSGVGALGSR